MMTLQQLQDRTLSASVTHIALCPNMRLLAVALDANSIAVFRASWQRLATIAVTTSSSDELITSVAWSPTGAHIVATTSQSRLLTYSVDRAMSAAASTRARRGARDTDPVASLKLQSPATTVLWAQPLSQSKTPYDNSASVLLPISLLAKSRSSEHQSAHSHDAERGFIFVGDSKGYLTILTSDLSFKIAYTCVTPSDVPISRIHVTACGKRCVIIASNATSQKDSSVNNTDGNGDVLMRIVDLRFLRKFRHEIERIAQEVVAWNSFLNTAKECVEQIEKAWSESVSDIFLKSIVRPLQEVMQQYAEEDGNVWDELFDVFCGARIKGSLLHFLNSSLGENGAKELLRAFEVHDNEAMEAFQKVLPFAENATSMASELRSLAHVTTRFEPVGVLIEDANHLFDAASEMYNNFFLKSEDLRMTSNEPSFFLYWIVITARKSDNSGESQQNDQLGGWETQCILKFFEKMTQGNSKNVAPSDKVKDMEAGTEVEEMDHSSDTAYLSEEVRVKAAFEIKLSGYVDAVQNMLKPITEKPSGFVSMRLNVLAGFSLENWCSSKWCLYDYRKHGESSTTAVFTDEGQRNGEIMVVKYRCSGKPGWSVWRVGIEGKTIHDVTTHKGDRFIMVVEDELRKGEYCIEVASNTKLGLSEEKKLDLTAMVVVKTEDVATTNVNLETQNNIKLIANEKQKINGLRMNQNEETGILSVLAMPKRVALFGLSDVGDH